MSYIAHFVGYDTERVKVIEENENKQFVVYSVKIDEKKFTVILKKKKAKYICEILGEEDVNYFINDEGAVSVEKILSSEPHLPTRIESLQEPIVYNETREMELLEPIHMIIEISKRSKYKRPIQ